MLTLTLQITLKVPYHDRDLIDDFTLHNAIQSRLNDVVPHYFPKVEVLTPSPNPYTQFNTPPPICGELTRPGHYCTKAPNHSSPHI